MSTRFVEVACPVDAVPSQYRVDLYDGRDGEPYGMSKRLSDPESCFMGVNFFVLPFPNIMNGGNGGDGIALSCSTGRGRALLEFLSYEGEIRGTRGPANNFNSTDIGVAESECTGFQVSISRGSTGFQPGCARDDFNKFFINVQSAGEANTGIQQIGNCPRDCPSEAPSSFPSVSPTAVPSSSPSASPSSTPSSSP